MSMRSSRQLCALSRTPVWKPTSSFFPSAVALGLRRHSLELLAKGVDYEVRETFESALEFGRAALEALGLTAERAVDVRDYVRKRDLERLGLQQVEGITAGRELIYARMVQPEPLSTPLHESTALNEEAEELVGEEAEPGE